MNTSGSILSVNRDSEHRFSKPAATEITLIAGLGIEGDAHAGATVRHLHRLKTDAAAPNLRQVHLIHSELFEELESDGFGVSAGDLGENVTTSGIDLLALPRGTRLHLGDEAVVEVTGLRNPCSQINRFEPGLMKAVIGKADDGAIVRKSGIMSVVTVGGVVRPGDAIRVELPAGDQVPLEVV